MVNPKLPPENWMIKMAPLVMVMGAALTLTALVFGFVAGALADDVNVAKPDNDEVNFRNAVLSWIMPLALTGVAFVLVAITIFLRGIFKGIRFMGGNVTEAIVHYVGAGHAHDAASPAPPQPARRARVSPSQ